MYDQTRWICFKAEIWRAQFFFFHMLRNCWHTSKWKDHKILRGFAVYACSYGNGDGIFFYISQVNLNNWQSIQQYTVFVEVETWVRSEFSTKIYISAQCQLVFLCLSLCSCVLNLMKSLDTDYSSSYCSVADHNDITT